MWWCYVVWWLEEKGGGVGEMNDRGREDAVPSVEKSGGVDGKDRDDERRMGEKNDRESW